MFENDINAKILNNIKYERSDKESARRLGMNIEMYKEKKWSLKQGIKAGKAAETANYIAILEDKITEQSYNLDNGTGKITGIMSTEPMSGEEIEIAFKVDTKKWKLSGYWNKAQPNGTFLVSANVSLLKKDDPILLIDDIKLAIKQVFDGVKMIPYFFPKNDSNAKTLMVYCSDKHIGAMVPEDSLYTNVYSADIFADRMNKLLDEICFLKDTYGKFENIYILDLGDALDGWNAQTTRGGHILPQNMTNRQAFETYLRVHKDFFDRLLTHDFANNFSFKTISNSNHASDFAYITTRALEEYLNLKYPQVNTAILNKFMEHFNVGKHTFICTHGKDDSDMKHGFPLHLNDKTINFINNYIDENDINHKISNVHLIKGDLHQDTSEATSRFRYRNTCSMFGSSKWAMHNFIPQAPGVSFDIIENNTDRVFEYKLQFSTKSTIS